MNKQKPIEVIDFIAKLSVWLRYVSLFFLLVGILGFLSGEYDFRFTDNIINFIENFQLIFIGLIFLSLSNNLIKKERWAFYSLVFLCCLIIFLHVTVLIFTFSFQSLGSLLSIIFVGVTIYWMYLLINGRRFLIEQPKEKISQWFHKPAFIFVIVITIGLLAGEFAKFFIKIYYEIYIEPNLIKTFFETWQLLENYENQPIK